MQSLSLQAASEANVLPSDLADARRYSPAATEDELRAFAARQLESRRRTGLWLAFYRQHPSRMARIHVLTACAVTLGRFWGVSQAFRDMGVGLAPTDDLGEPRGPRWTAYAEACLAGRPWPLRDELWMAAHLADFESIRQQGLDQRFYAEAESHRDDPTWRLLRLHMEMTLGARLIDHVALAGHIPHETAIADGIAVSLSRIVRSGGALLGRYASEAARAILLPRADARRDLVTYRRLAFALITSSITAWTAAATYRRGVRGRERGRQAESDGWPLLAEVLGDEVRNVDPLIVAFYTNPGRFSVHASLDLHTIPARFWSYLATLLIGQGLYEADREAIETRFKVFRRADGSMHFVRELIIGGALRVFDSDFVVRRHRGKPTLFEVFLDLGIDVAMEVKALPGGGLSIRGQEILFRGLKMPTLGLEVEFISKVVEGTLAIDGHLRMRPATALGRFIMRTVLRRPEQLGCIHYRAIESGHLPN